MAVDPARAVRRQHAGRIPDRAADAAADRIDLERIELPAPVPGIEARLEDAGAAAGPGRVGGQGGGGRGGCLDQGQYLLERILQGIGRIGAEEATAAVDGRMPEIGRAQAVTGARGPHFLRFL